MLKQNVSNWSVRGDFGSKANQDVYLGRVQGAATEDMMVYLEVVRPGGEVQSWLLSATDWIVTEGESPQGIRLQRKTAYPTVPPLRQGESRRSEKMPPAMELRLRPPQDRP